MKTEERDRPALEKFAILEEYKSLRNEILDRNRNGLYALAILFAGLGALGSLIGSVGFDLKEDDERAWFALAVTTAALVFSFPIVQFVKINFQSTLRIGVYLRLFHEDRVRGLRWETRLHQYRAVRSTGWTLTRSVGLLALGVAVSSLLAMAFLLSIGATPWFTVGSVALFVGLAYQGLDLLLRFSAGWKSEEYWQEVKRREKGSAGDEA